MRGLLPHQAAAREAFEEAGIAGVLSPVSIGSFRYDKRRVDGTMREATVDVFPLAVVNQFDDWPEQGQREVRWLAQADAAEAVSEPELKALIVAFRPPPRAADDAEPVPDLATLRRWSRWRLVRWFRALLHL